MAASSASSTMLLDLVSLIARSLVDHPEKVVVREVTGDRFPRIELSVAREDIGKVIGKDGRTAQSIRALLNAAASKAGLRAHLDILVWARVALGRIPRTGTRPSGGSSPSPRSRAPMGSRVSCG